MKHMKRIACFFGAAALTLALSGCEGVLSPAGYVGDKIRDLILTSFFLMLCIVIPVMIAVVVFAIKYRAGNKKAEYLPDWEGSSKIEFWMWIIPILMVSALAILSAYFIHKVDPSVERLPEQVAGTEEPLKIDAIAMDWKWLFIYPQYGVASVNEIYAPTGRQVRLQLTSESSINAFWVPKLGSLLYAMPQMNSKLRLIADENGVFPGVSGNYSGEGFANMRFDWHSVPQGEFNSWIARAHESHERLDRAAYLKLADAKIAATSGRTEWVKPIYYSGVEKDLYWRVVNRCVQEGASCNETLMWKAAQNSLWGGLCSVFPAGYKAPEEVNR